MPIPKVVSKTPLYDRYKRAGGQFNYTHWKEKGTPSLPMSAAARALAAKPAAAKAAPAPVDPTAWLNTPDEKTIDKQVQAETYSKYHPQFQQFIEARKVSDANQKRIGDWYSQYAAEIKAGADASQNAATSAAQATSDASKTLEAGAATEQAARQAAANADAKTRGATAVDFTDLANRASLSRQSGANASASLMRDLGTNAYTRSQGIAGNVVGAQKLQALTQEAANKKKLETGRTDLIKQMGDYRIANKEQRRQTERNYIAATDALGIKASNAASLQATRDAATALAQLKSEGATQEQIDAAQAKLDAALETKRHNKAMEKGGETTKSDLTPTQARSYKVTAQTAASTISGMMRDGIGMSKDQQKEYDALDSPEKKTTYRKEHNLPNGQDLKNRLISGISPTLVAQIMKNVPSGTPESFVRAALSLYGSRMFVSNSPLLAASSPLLAAKFKLKPAQLQELASYGLTPANFRF